MKNESRSSSDRKIRIVIYVDGGIVQDVLADAPRVEAMIVDHDNERAVRPVCSKPA